MHDKSVQEQLVAKQIVERKKLRDVPGEGNCFYLASVLQLLCDPLTSPFVTFDERFDHLVLKLKEFNVDTKNINRALIKEEIDNHYANGKTTPEKTKHTPGLAHLVSCIRQCLVNYLTVKVIEGDEGYIYTLYDDYILDADMTEEARAEYMTAKLLKHVSDRYYADAATMLAFAMVFDCSIEQFSFSTKNNRFIKEHGEFERQDAASTIQIAFVNGEDPLIEHPKNHYARFYAPAEVKPQSRKDVNPPSVTAPVTGDPIKSDSVKQNPQPVLEPVAIIKEPPLIQEKVIVVEEPVLTEAKPQAKKNVSTPTVSVPVPVEPVKIDSSKQNPIPINEPEVILKQLPLEPEEVIIVQEPVVEEPALISDLEQLRAYAQKTQESNPHFSLALFNYITKVEEATKKNSNNSVIVEQLNNTTTQVKKALMEHNPEALLEAANTAYGSVSLPKKVGMAICGSLCILAGVVGIGLAVASIIASYGASSPLALWSTSLSINLIIAGSSLVAGAASSYGFFSQAADKNVATATKELHDELLRDDPGIQV